MMQNTIKFLALALMIFGVQKTFCMDGIKNFVKEKYGTTIMAGTLVAFAVHTSYNQYIHQYKNKLSQSIKKAIPISIVPRNDITFYSIPLTPLILSLLLGINHFSSGKFQFLNNNKNLMWQFTQISAGVFLPSLCLLITCIGEKED